MKKILLLLFVVLLLAGGGGGYYYFFVMAAGDEIAEEPPPPPPDFRFVEMDNLQIPVIRGGAVVNYVILSVSLETIGPENEERARELLPRLVNNYITDLNGYFETVPVEDRIMVNPLKRRMRVIADRTLGPGVVSDVLIKSAFKQRR
jgi:flagellar FliL protein